MARYKVTWTEHTLCTKWVEADNEEQAMDKCNEDLDAEDVKKEFEGTSDWETREEK